MNGFGGGRCCYQDANRRVKGGDLRTTEVAGELCLVDIFVITKLSGGFLCRSFAFMSSVFHVRDFLAVSG